MRFSKISLGTFGSEWEEAIHEGSRAALDRLVDFGQIYHRYMRAEVHHRW